MAKSKSVHVSVLYPYSNLMIVERTYEFEKDFNARRQQNRLPKNFKRGWTFLGTMKDDYVKAGNTGFWTIREIYVEDKHVFNMAK